MLSPVTIYVLPIFFLQGVTTTQQLSESNGLALAGEMEIPLLRILCCYPTSPVNHCCIAWSDGTHRHSKLHIYISLSKTSYSSTLKFLIFLSFVIMHIQNFSLTILHQIQNLNKQRCNLNHNFIILYQNLTFSSCTLWVKIHPYFIRGSLTPHMQWVKIHPWLEHNNTFTMYIVGENSPMTF